MPLTDLCSQKCQEVTNISIILETRKLSRKSRSYIDKLDYEKDFEKRLGNPYVVPCVGARKANRKVVRSPHRN